MGYPKIWCIIQGGKGQITTMRKLLLLPERDKSFTQNLSFVILLW